MHAKAGGQAPQRASLVPDYLRGESREVGELNDAGAAALFVTDETCSQRADHAKVARFAQRFFVVCFHISNAGNAHETCGAGAACGTRVVGKHLADVNDNIGGGCCGRCGVVVVAFIKDGLAGKEGMRVSGEERVGPRGA